MALGLRDEEVLLGRHHHYDNQYAGAMSGPPFTSSDTGSGSGSGPGPINSPSPSPSPNRTISFDPNLYNPRVEVLTSGALKTVSWQDNTLAVVRNASLWVYPNPDAPPSQNMTLTIIRNGMLPFHSQVSFTVNSMIQQLPLYVELGWDSATGVGSGKSTSGVFGVSDTAANAAALDITINEMIDSNNDLGVGTETLPGNGQSSLPATGLLPSTTAALAPTTSGAVSASTNPAMSGSPAATVIASSSGSGSLSTGAIAGIAVAAVVLGLALLAFLAWFFCLRLRRRNGHDHVRDAPYGSGGDPHHAGVVDYLADKEAHATVVADSPNSPYSDDAAAVRGTRDQTAGRGMVAGNPTGYFHPEAAPAPHHEPPEDGRAGYHSYSDEAALAGPGTTTRSMPAVAAELRSGARSATPQGVPHSVAHLVEEGMTDEQILRLEEEERALDEAIARSGRR